MINRTANQASIVLSLEKCGLYFPPFDDGPSVALFDHLLT